MKHWEQVKRTNTCDRIAVFSTNSNVIENMYLKRAMFCTFTMLEEKRIRSATSEFPTVSLNVNGLWENVWYGKHKHRHSTTASVTIKGKGSLYELYTVYRSAGWVMYLIIFALFFVYDAFCPFLIYCVFYRIFILFLSYYVALWRFAVWGNKYVNFRISLHWQGTDFWKDF